MAEVHGRWILEREPNGKPYCFHCSVCDSDYHCIGIVVASDYCPNCGAKMDGRVVASRWIPFHSEVAGDIQYCSNCEIGNAAKTEVTAMRLIDADKLEKQEYWGNERWFDCVDAEDIDNAPTVDAVEVVRCKDCKHYEMGVCLKIYSDGNVHSAAWQKRKPDDFCSYGERKEGADNG